jgi:hypothetical protein
MFDGRKLTLTSTVARLRVDATRKRAGVPATPPPAMPLGKRKQKHGAVQRLLTELRLTQPIFAEPLPLAIGIHEAIKAELGCDGIILAIALRCWCSSPVYLKSVARGRTTLRARSQRLGRGHAGANGGRETTPVQVACKWGVTEKKKADQH